MRYTKDMSRATVLDKYRVDVSRESDGTFLAVCPGVQGVYAEGKTYLDAVLNVEDVLRNVLELQGVNEPIRAKRQTFSVEIPNPLVWGMTA